MPLLVPFGGLRCLSARKGETRKGEPALADMLESVSRSGLGASLGLDVGGAESIQAMRVALDDEAAARMQAVANARVHNLQLRPRFWPRFATRVRAPVMLVMALDQAGDDWERVEKKAALVDALGDQGGTTCLTLPVQHIKFFKRGEACSESS